jgi:iron complex transport system ATP-binding protein
MEDIIVEVQNLSFHYPKRKVFDNINLNIKRNQIFMILGPNGCGKTTLLHCILHYLKPQTGEIRIAKKNIKEIKATELARKIAYVPQNHRKMFPYSVKEVVLMGRAAYTPAYSSPKAEDMDIAMDALELIGIKHLAEQPYMNLSGGESQLVLLARAIAQKSDVIILDEPTVHLDSFNEMLVLDKLSYLMQKNDLTILMTTHYPNQAFYFINKGLPVYGALMKDGGFIAAGHGSEIFQSENLSDLYGIRFQSVELTDDQGNKIKQIIPMGIEQNR